MLAQHFVIKTEIDYISAIKFRPVRVTLEHELNACEDLSQMCYTNFTS